MMARPDCECYQGGVLARSIATCAAILWLAACGGRPAERYLLSEDYVGWVEVRFNVPGAPTFPREDGFRLMNVPDSGKIMTSEVALTGEGYRRQYYYDLDDGSRREAQVAGGFTITDPSAQGELRWYFFIGTPADYERYKRLYGYDPHALKTGSFRTDPN